MEESIVDNYKEALEDVLSEVHSCKETLKSLMEDEYNYHLVTTTINRLEVVLKRAGVDYE